MTDEGIEALRAEHVPGVGFRSGERACRKDAQLWPCDTARLFAGYDAAIAEVARLRFHAECPPLSLQTATPEEWAAYWRNY